MEKLYEITTEFHRLDRNVPLALYRPVEKTERSKIAFLAMHGLDYLSFKPIINLARRGFITTGANPVHGHQVKGRVLDVKAAVDFMKSYPGVEKLIIIGHSGGGSLTTCYQYIAENGTERFEKAGRYMPFPEIELLTPADGMALLDNNYGIMPVLAMDPAVEIYENGFRRNPDLDISNPEFGYDPKGSHYTKEFIERFQKAQINYYRKTFDDAKQKYEDIRAGRGNFLDNDTMIFAGCAGGSPSNKLFLQDTSLLSRTKREHTLLHNGGETSTEIVHTCRLPQPAPDSRCFGNALRVDIVDYLEQEFRFFDDFGYNDCDMWGADWNAIPSSTRANVAGISVPLLIGGNTGSHEFVQAEINYDWAEKSKDKQLFFLEGASHEFDTLKEAEKYPGQFGDTQQTLADYVAKWALSDGRFLK